MTSGRAPRLPAPLLLRILVMTTMHAVPCLARAALLTALTGLAVGAAPAAIPVTPTTPVNPATLITPASPVDDFAGTLVRGPVGQRADAWLSRLVPLGFSGGVLVARDGEVLLRKGYGLSDRERGVPFATDTAFPNGSITKPYTAAAILVLEQQGQLRTDDLLSLYLGPVPPDKRELTLHHLLTHSSGLPGAIGRDFDPVERDDYVARALGTELLFPPGARYQYSNVGYALLAAVLETVTGDSYEHFVQQHLFGPAGLTRTGYALGRFEESDLAHGYLGDESFGTMRDHAWTDEGPYWHLRGNGGLHTTLEDAWRWHLALLGDEILTPASKQKHFASFIDEGSGDSFYGYGWVSTTSPRGTRVVQHDGGNPYFSSDFKRWLDEDAVLFVHSNTGDIKAYQLSQPLEWLLFEDALPLPPEVRALDDAEADALLGEYALPSGAALLLSRTGDHLTLQPRGEDAYGLLRGAGQASLALRTELSARALAVLSAAAAGDHQPALDAFAGRMPPDRVRESFDDMLAEFDTPGGAPPTLESLGTVPLDDPDAPPGLLISYVRVTGDRGAGELGLAWMGGQLVGFDLPDPFPGLAAWPTPDGHFVTWSLDAARGLRLAMHRDETGRVTSIDISGDGSPVSATRRGP